MRYESRRTNGLSLVELDVGVAGDVGIGSESSHRLNLVLRDLLLLGQGQKVVKVICDKIIKHTH